MTWKRKSRRGQGALARTSACQNYRWTAASLLVPVSLLSVSLPARRRNEKEEAEAEAEQESTGASINQSKDSRGCVAPSWQRCPHTLQHL